MATKEIIKLNMNADTGRDIAAATRTLTRKQDRATQTVERKPDRIRFACPNCGSRVKADYGQEGKQFFCPFCRKPGLVPYPDKPYLHQDEEKKERAAGSTVRATFLMITCLVLFVCVLYVQRRAWMPWVGVQPARQQIVPSWYKGELDHLRRPEHFKPQDAASRALRKASGAED